MIPKCATCGYPENPCPRPTRGNCGKLEYAEPIPPPDARDDSRDADKRRLDWLATGEHEVWARNGEWFTRNLGSTWTHSGKTPREAIDRAIEHEAALAAAAEPYPRCTTVLRAQGTESWPRTCAECGLGPCKRTGSILTNKRD